TDNRLVITRSTLQIPIALCAVGVIAFVAGLFTATDRTWLNLLIDGWFVLALGVGGVFFIASQRLANSKWWSPMRRVPEAFSLLLIPGVGLMVVLGFGFHSLYPWTDPAGPGMNDAHPLIHEGRHEYLAPAFTYARMIIIVGLWTLFALRMRQISLAGDA